MKIVKIKTTDNRGIHLTRADGIVFSIQFGPYHYCGDYYGVNRRPTNTKEDAESSDCEVAVFDKNNKFITREVYPENDDDVIGYVPIYEAIMMAINYVPQSEDKEK